MKKALFQLHIAIFLWGATGVLGKIINLNEAWLVWYRLLITFCSIFVLDLFLKEVQPTTLKEKYSMGFTGGFQAIHWVFFFASVKYANVAVALICLSSSSFFTIIIDALIHRKKVNNIELLLSAVSIVGIACVFYADFELKKGISFGILSSIFIAVVPILNKKSLTTINAPTITKWNIAGGLLVLTFLLPIYLYFFKEGNYLPTLKDWGWLIVLSWLCTIVTWRLSLTALQKLSPFTQNLLLNLEPLYGIALAAIFFKEYKTYNLFFYLGILLILSTIVLQTLLIKKSQIQQQ